MPREWRGEYEQHPIYRAEGAEVLLRVADRLHRDRTVRAAGWMVFRRDALLLRAPESADDPVRDERAAGDEHQPADDPAAAVERGGAAAFRPAGADDADLLGGKAIGGNRAAADVAGDGFRDHRR